MNGLMDILRSAGYQSSLQPMMGEGAGMMPLPISPEAPGRRIGQPLMSWSSYNEATNYDPFAGQQRSQPTLEQLLQMQGR